MDGPGHTSRAMGLDITDLLRRCYMKKIVCIGDSLTRWGQVSETVMWPYLLQELLGIPIINSGVSGDATTGMLGRFYQDVVAHKPDYVIIMGGGNDVWWDVPRTVTRANIYSMIKQALHHHITPIIGIPAPACPEAFNPDWVPALGFERFKEEYHKYAQSLIDDMASVNGFLVLDFRDKFYDESGRVIKEYFLLDDGHLNEAGNWLMAQIAADYLKTKPVYTGTPGT